MIGELSEHHDLAFMMFIVVRAVYWGVVSCAPPPALPCYWNGILKDSLISELTKHLSASGSFHLRQNE